VKPRGNRVFTAKRLRERGSLKRMKMAEEMAKLRARATTNGGNFPENLGQLVLTARPEELGSAFYPLRVRSNDNEF
jgi:hypothetical protein